MNGSVIEENVPETEEAADESLRVSEPNHGFENASKLSYASVVSGHSNLLHACLTSRFGY